MLLKIYLANWIPKGGLQTLEPFNTIMECLPESTIGIRQLPNFRRFTAVGHFNRRKS
jgi:hypothetical protein